MSHESSKNPHGLTVGRELFLVLNRRHLPGGKPVTVTAVGRKWAEIDHGKHRINIQTLYVDGGGYSSPGRCYLSEQEWKDNVLRKDAWGSLRQKIERMYTLPADLTIQKMDQIAELLGIDRGEA